jgi:hypothetical protein
VHLYGLIRKLRGKVGRVNQIKTAEYSSKINSVGKCFEKSERLNLNDLLKKRKKEEQVDKKTNLLIISGATAVATGVVLAIFSL